ncbi:MAG: hypothetical protein QMD23_03765 [Candidatus Bathyarchaeia archaeon]|nr:hypothetical protein [Candidatus Bathyarchaeia archaeon]
MHDALIGGLEAILYDLEEGINEADELIRSKSNEALRERNEIKLCWAWDLFKGAFSRDPTNVELSSITGLSQRSVDDIIMSENFNYYIKSVKRGKLEGYERVATYKGIPILIKKRRGRRKFSVKREKRGRPSIVYSEDDGGLPRALAFWTEVFSRAGKNQDVRKSIERLEQVLKQKSKQELGWIVWDAMDETYLHQVTGAVAHRLFEIYALPSSGRVYSYLFKTFNELTEKLDDIVEKYLEKLLNANERERSKELLRKIAEEMKENVVYMEKIVKFSELAKERKSHVVASAFKKWMNNYRLMHIRSHIDKILWEAYEENREVSDLAGSIFNMIDEQVQGVIAIFLKECEKDLSRGF